MPQAIDPGRAAAPARRPLRAALRRRVAAAVSSAVSALPALSAVSTVSAVSVFAALPAAAGTLQLSVTGADGQPAADTVVMLRRAGAFQPVDRGAPAVVTQKGLRFQPNVTVVPVRGTVRFVNQDRYDHHVRSMPGGPLGSVPPVSNFEFRLAAARGGNEPSAEIRLDTPGAIVLGCHIHGSMRAHLYVSPTPWFAVTDAEGRAVVEVPDGPAEVLLWHPDQLGEQAPRPLQVAGASSQALALNFSPRRRAAAPPRPDEYRY